jgi:hypothetical protein
VVFPGRAALQQETVIGALHENRDRAVQAALPVRSELGIRPDSAVLGIDEHDTVSRGWGCRPVFRTMVFANGHE